jgi:hypothetical protein
MLKSYFLDLNKKIVKKSAGKKGAASKSASGVDEKLLTEKLSGIIPERLKIEKAKLLDSSGFSPEGADLIVYREYCADIVKLFNGYVPYELIYGSIFIVNDLTKTTLADVINRVATVKKINRFSETESKYTVPAFIIANASADYPLAELKNDILNYYMSRGIEGESEFEIMALLNRGVLVKDWHQGNRSFAALETLEDTIMWFYILFSEYLEVEREDEFDLRKYVRNDKVYKEY